MIKVCFCVGILLVLVSNFQRTVDGMVGRFC